MTRDKGHAGEGTVQLLVFLASMVPAALLAGLAAWLVHPIAGGVVLALGAVVARYISSRFKVIAQWENAPLLKFGKVRVSIRS